MDVKDRCARVTRLHDPPPPPHQHHRRPASQRPPNPIAADRESEVLNRRPKRKRNRRSKSNLRRHHLDTYGPQNQNQPQPDRPNPRWFPTRIRRKSSGSSPAETPSHHTYFMTVFLSPSPHHGFSLSLSFGARCVKVTVMHEGK